MLNLIKVHWLKILVACIIFFIMAAIILNNINENRILNQFSNNLYNYPLPEDTIILEKTKSQAPNSSLGWGNNNRQDVVATMRLSTKLTIDEISKNYKNVILPFPKYTDVNKGQGVTIELYFEDESEKRDMNGVIYYEKKIDNKKFSPVRNNEGELVYILQARSDY